MARKRKPLKLLKLEGNYRKDRHGDRQPLLASEAVAPDKPEFITGAAGVEWDRATKALLERGTLSTLNMATLTQYCLMWAELENNYTKGGEPLGAAFHTSFRLVCAEMGITPTSQDKITIPEKTTKKKFKTI